MLEPYAFPIGDGNGQCLQIREDGGLSVPQEVYYNAKDVRGLAEAATAAADYMEKEETR